MRVRADQLPRSWESALIALRLTDESEPVVDAAELGILLSLALAFDPAAPPEDVVALARLDERSRGALAALIEADSVRAAATAWGVHHSTMQARYESLTRELGVDPRSPLGRARLIAAELLLRLMP